MSVWVSHSFESGMTAFKDLLHDLTILVDDHDKWQVVDLELRRIESNVGQDTFELEMSWPELKDLTEPLYSASSDDWAVSFQRDAANLEQALDTANPVHIKRYFRSYRRRAGVRFHQVDVDLKRLCEGLSAIGEPLDSVMRIIA